MIDIYHVPGTRSVRVIWLCEELAVAYNVIAVDFSQQYRASPEWRKLNPVGKVPVMKDGDLTIFESGAMVEYLLDRYGKGRLRPEPGTEQSGIYLQWCWFAEATFARPLGEIVNHRRVFGDENADPAMIAEMADRAGLCIDALEMALRSEEYLCAGVFTAADIMMGYSLLLAQRLELMDDSHPQVEAYWQRLRGRPAFVKATA